MNMDDKYILIDKELNERLNRIVQCMFTLNRIYDAGGSVLGVKFVMSNFLKEYHDTVFHAFPKIADLVSAIQENYNTVTTYYDTPTGKNDYENPLAFFEEVLDYLLYVQKYISETQEFASVLSDTDNTGTSYVISKALNRLAKIIGKFVGQALLLRDKSRMYGQDNLGIMLFDAEIDDYLIISADDLPESLLV